jgi:hypothetical protein
MNLSRLFRCGVPVFLLILPAITLYGQQGGSESKNDLVPSGKGIGTLYHPGNSSDHPGNGRQNSPGQGSNGIYYHGGPVITNTKHVYFIWYGNWSGNTTPTILHDFISNLGGSSYFNINTTYTNGANQKVTNAVLFSGDFYDNYSHGTSLSDSDVQAIVASFNANDPDGVYFVLTSADVNETSGFCKQYCGWHTNASIGGQQIKYAFVGNPDRCPSACEEQAISPNGNAGADGMTSIIAHELEEAATDPQLNAWYDQRGYENADKCAWTFGQTYTAANGSKANMRLGSRDYLIQRNWVNAGGGYCALQYP